MEMGKEKYFSYINEVRSRISNIESIMVAYESGITKEELVKKVCTGGYLGDKSWTTASYIVKKVFARRMLNGLFKKFPPAEFMSAAHQEKTGYKIKWGEELLFIFTALAEAPLYDFVCQCFYNQTHKDIDSEDVIYFLRCQLDNKEQEWSETKVKQSARGIVVTLKEFGFLIEKERGVFTINPPILTNTRMFELIYFLNKNGLSDRAIVYHDIWYLFGLNGNDIIKRITNFPHLYIVQSAGAVTALSRPEVDDSKFLKLIAGL